MDQSQDDDRKRTKKNSQFNGVKLVVWHVLRVKVIKLFLVMLFVWIACNVMVLKETGVSGKDLIQHRLI